ncbi:hypothetical protein [Streptacidiphilus rugosus]|uniref:hypothetical protein n=1 Tax=Streptacidiphilus rugosus TaxID=405783 RepID=UPI0005676B5B|nr:hypothetical protein [Streptacidiphilus rugosus]
MKVAGAASWTIVVDEWSSLLESPLWLRAAERIEVAPEGLVPGALAIDPLPAPSLEAGLAAEPALAEAWRAWWQASVAQAFGKPTGDFARDTAIRARFGPPGFESVAPGPLREAAQRRWAEAMKWHNARKRAGVQAMIADGARQPEGEVVRAVEAQLGRRAEPFSVSLTVIPVLDDRIRSVGGRAFLIPEHLRGTPRYADWLHGLVRALA